MKDVEKVFSYKYKLFFKKGFYTGKKEQVLMIAFKSNEV